MRTVYRRHRGWDGRVWWVRVPEAELRGLLTTIFLITAALFAVMIPAAYLAGLLGR